MTHTFHTNINCGSCIAKVKPHLDEAVDIQSWSVDTDNPKKILTVETEHLSAKEVARIVQGAGYEAAPISKGFISRLMGK